MSTKNRNDKENISKQNNESSNFSLDEKQREIIFCPTCLMFPEYYIKLSNSSFSLVHKCADNKEKEKPFALPKRSFLHALKCAYCMNRCDNLCVKCKNLICNKCLKEHCKRPYIHRQNNELKIEDPVNSQFICSVHLFNYQFYCPICKINLCEKCKEEHYHMNCPSLIKTKLECPKQIESTNEQLSLLSESFYYCYNKSYLSNKMTLNILLNTNLANNIINYIKNPDAKIIEIKNNFWLDVQKKPFICENNTTSEFNKYYSVLLSQVSLGEIKYFHLLGDIEKMNENLEEPLIFKNCYYTSLKSNIGDLKNLLYSLKLILDSNATNLMLTEYIKETNYLKLKIEVSNFCLELLKKSSIKMNYKLDFEMRRKMGNVIGQLLLENFHENLVEIKPTERLIALSSEKIKEKIIKNKSSPKKNKNNSDLLKLKTKYKSSMDMLINLANKAKEDIDKEDSSLLSYGYKNDFQFKKLSEDKTEVDKAIICNLFFIVRNKLSKEFNENIHNLTVSINSLIKNEIDILEGRIKNKDEKKEANEAEEEKNDKNESEKEVSENENVIQDQDKTCLNNYSHIREIKKILKIKEKTLSNCEIEYPSYDNDEIINSAIERFYDIIKEMKTVYNTPLNFPVEKSVDLFFDGKKGDVLYSVQKFEKKSKIKIIEECKKISDEDEKAIQKITEFYEKEKNKIEDDLDILYTNFDTIIEEIEDISEFFDIKKLFNKYSISVPLDPLKEIMKIRGLKLTSQSLEEIYYLILLVSFLFCDSEIKEVEKMRQSLEKMNVVELCKSNIIKKKLVKIFCDEIEKSDQIDLTNKIWNDIKKGGKLVEDEEMNLLIKNYIEKNDKEDYKKDLINLISPFCKNIDFSGKDPQNIILESFMKQNDLNA